MLLNGCKSNTYVYVGREYSKRYMKSKRKNNFFFINMGTNNYHNTVLYSHNNFLSGNILIKKTTNCILSELLNNIISLIIYFPPRVFHSVQLIFFVFIILNPIKHDPNFFLFLKRNYTYS